MSNIAIFASGSGTNAENIIRFFRPDATIHIRLLLSNKADAKALERAKKYGIATYVFDRQIFYNSDQVLNILEEHEITHIILAGFLWLVPGPLISRFPNAIVNIHPALLPKYGGKGMYGHKVHESVIANREKESGITIHYVNEHYDEGNIIFQARCPVCKDDTPDSLANRIHELEYEHFPRVIREVIQKEQR